MSFAFALPAASGADEPAVSGHIVLARATDEALVIWDASPVIADVVKGKLSDDDANKLVAHDALKVLAMQQPNVDKGAKSITIRIVYSKTGAVSPYYGNTTFAGIERYATLSTAAGDVATDKNNWKELGDSAALPSFLPFTVIGKLPPR